MARAESSFGGNPVGHGLPERAGFFKKGLSAGCFRVKRLAKNFTDSIWSCSENADNPDNAFGLNFNNGWVNNNNKDNNLNRVRPVLASLTKPIAKDEQT